MLYRRGRGREGARGGWHSGGLVTLHNAHEVYGLAEEEVAAVLTRMGRGKALMGVQAAGWTPSKGMSALLTAG